MGNLDFSAMSFDAMLGSEWLAVNHTGGYAASTLPGCNTRKYHGLLVAAMSPPVRRMVLLSRVEETIFHDGWPHSLACNEYPDTVHPDGYKRLRAFSAEPFPRWAYQGAEWTIEKNLRMLRGENTLVLSYTLLGADKPVELEVRPLFALRGIHELMYQWNANLTPHAVGVGHYRIPATHRTPEIFFAHEGKFTPDGYWYLNTIYRREPERGYSGLEDLWSPGAARYELHPGQTAHFVCSTDPIDLQRVITEARRQYAAPAAPVVEKESPDPDLVTLCRAAGQFVAKTRDDRTMLLNGYPWAPPSGRDAMIALPGALLVTGRLKEAKAVLEYFAALVNKGLMPSEFPTDGAAPRYQAADTSLWFINALHHYLRYSADQTTVRVLYETVEEILTSCEQGTSLGVHVDRDGLLAAGAAGIPVTWMNAQVNDQAVTPRHGRAVEVNALWFNALRIGSDLARRFHHVVRAEEWATAANKCRHSFNRLFWNHDTGCCFDVVTDHGNDGAIRPNQLLAVSLVHPVLDIERHEAVLTRIKEELLTPLGLRTLSRRDSRYQGRYGGPIISRDHAYHQGSIFPWLLGPFVSAFVRVYGANASTRALAAQFLRPTLEHLRGAGCGQVHELFDGEAPHRPGGLTASARSVAEILRAYAEDVLDIGLPGAQYPAPQTHAPDIRSTPL